jgi:hypothetical protein
MEVSWNFFRQIFYIPKFKKEILARVRVPAAFFFLVNFFFKLAPKKCFFLGYLVAKFRNCLKLCQILHAFPVGSQKYSPKGDEILLLSSYFVYSKIGLNPLMGWSPLTPGDLVFGDFSPLGYKKIGKITELSKPQNWLKNVLKKKLLLTPATSQNGKNKSLRLWPNSPNTGFL